MQGKKIFDIIADKGYETHSLLGKGGFAECYKVFSNYYKEYFAIKIIPISGAKSESRKKSFENEMKVLTSIIHPNVIQVYQTFSSNSHLFLILELCPNGDLQKYITKNGPIKNVTVLLNYISPILGALAYMESIGIAHKDIKPSNIFIDRHGRPKLADFGISAFVDENKMSNDCSGSLVFSAPEILMLKPHNPFKSDVWSFGVTLYFLVTGQYPFPSGLKQVTLRHMLTENYKIPGKMNETIKYIIANCLKAEPEKRMTFAQLKEIMNGELEKHLVYQRSCVKFNKIKTAESCIIVPKIRNTGIKSITPSLSLYSKSVLCKN